MESATISSNTTNNEVSELKHYLPFFELVEIISVILSSFSFTQIEHKKLHPTNILSYKFHTITSNFCWSAQLRLAIASTITHKMKGRALSIWMCLFKSKLHMWILSVFWAIHVLCGLEKNRNLAFLYWVYIQRTVLPSYVVSFSLLLLLLFSFFGSSGVWTQLRTC
jgi:hypothetical protein